MKRLKNSGEPAWREDGDKGEGRAGAREPDFGEGGKEKKGLEAKVRGTNLGYLQ